MAVFIAGNAKNHKLQPKTSPGTGERKEKLENHGSSSQARVTCSSLVLDTFFSGHGAQPLPLVALCLEETIRLLLILNIYISIPLHIYFCSTCLASASL